jgi:ATP-dependent helicase/nuclease subunit B
MEDTERDQLVEDCLRMAVEEYGSFVFHSSARNEACIDRMERLAKRTVWAMQQQIRNGDFEPSEFEWRFQSRKDLEAIRLPLEHGGTMELQGIVDRVDYYEEGEDLYLKIIDYKSGAKQFSLEDIYYGLSLQLVVYCNAAVEKERKDKGKNIVPGGIFYFHMQDPLVEEKAGASLEEEMLEEFQLSGLALAEKDVIEHMSREAQFLPVGYLKNGNFSAYSSVATRDQFERMGAYVRDRLVQYGNEILDGNISIEPYQTEKRSACDYCDYRGVCGFDPAFSGNRYRKMGKLKKDTLWEKIEDRQGPEAGKKKKRPDEEQREGR